MQSPLIDEALPESHPRYRADIDGLRAIAVGSVVLFHAGLSIFPSGFVGVDIFFVISGFLIGGIIFRDVRANTFSFVTFYARRAKRILPALIGVVCFVLVAALILLTPREAMLASASGAASLFGTSNFFFWFSTDYFSEDARFRPLLMTWSLGVEEQFYVLFPLLMLGLRRWSDKFNLIFLSMLCGLSLAGSLYLTARYPAAAFYLLPARVWELAAGVLLAVLHIVRPSVRSQPGAASEVAGVVGFCTVILSIVLFDESTPFPGVAAILPVAGTALLVWSEASWINRRLLASAPMVLIGLLSYSWYLWHWPLMSLARIVAIDYPSGLTMALIALASLGMAYLSWRWIERPFRYAKIRNLVGLIGYGGAATTIAVLAGVIWLAHGFPGRVLASVNALEKVQTRVRGCFVHEGATHPDMSPACLEGDARQAVALVGDSHAEALAESLKTLASQRGIGFVQFTKASCPALLGVTRSDALYPRHADECAAFARNAVHALASDRRVGLVILAAYWSGPAESGSRQDHYVEESGARADSEMALLSQGVARTAAELRTAGKRVVVLGDSPAFSFDAGRAFKTRAMPVRRALGAAFGGRPVLAGDTIPWAYSLTPRLTARQAVMHGAAAVSGVKFYDLAGALCRRQGCAFASDDTPYYIDSHHLSASGSTVALSGLSNDPEWFAGPAR